MSEHIFPNISSWRLKKQRYALVGEVCPHCDAKIFPPRDVCPGECANRPDHSKQTNNQSENSLVYQAPAESMEEATSFSK